MAVHEPPQPASLDDLSARFPDHVADHDRLHRFYCRYKTMGELPDDFADSLARILDPNDHEAAAEIIEAATMLDDVGLRRFLQLFAARVRGSDGRITAEEIRAFLQQAARARR